MLPPEDSDDFDSQIQNAIQDLRKIKSGLSNDLGLLYFTKDFINSMDKQSNIFTPEKIKDHLIEASFTV